jgi:arsenite methyltransferase
MRMTKASAKYFEQVAGKWDTLRSEYFSPDVRVAAITKAYLRPEMVVADIGAGTGFISEGLAPLVRLVHLVDGSAAMLKVARRNLAGFNNIIYHEAEGHAIPLPEGSLDAVFANMYLHHTPDPLAAIQEMVRLLKPGGRLVITDIDQHSYTWMKVEMADEWMGFERSHIWRWFQEAGLVNIIVDCTGQTCCAESQNPANYDEKGRRTDISVFVATATRRINMCQAVQEAYGERAKYNSCCVSSQDQKIAVNEPEGTCCGGNAPNQSSCSDKTLTQDVIFQAGYSREERGMIPVEAEEISLGCGNPLALAHLRPGETVLDIGSGGGMDSFLAANQVGKNGLVIGVDMTPAMVERATATAKKNGFHNVEFRLGQAENLPLEAGTVDVILSNCVINLCEDKGAVFQEAFRVLKPGGRLEVTDMVTSAALPLASRQNAGEWAGCVSGALPEKEYLDLIAQAGFEKVSARRSTIAGEVEGVEVCSATISARKPSEVSCSCGGNC